jgi:hypothetical protein
MTSAGSSETSAPGTARRRSGRAAFTVVRVDPRSTTTRSTSPRPLADLYRQIRGTAERTSRDLDRRSPSAAGFEGLGLREQPPVDPPIPNGRRAASSLRVVAVQTSTETRIWTTAATRPSAKRAAQDVDIRGSYPSRRSSPHRAGKSRVERCGDMSYR